MKPDDLLSCLHRAAETYQDERLIETQFREDVAPAPRWSSGIDDVDRLTDGGFYGVSALIGPPKLGKSMIALRSSLAAAEGGAHTLIFDGENAGATTWARSRQVLGIDAPEHMPEWTDSWQHFSFEAGSNFDTLIERIGTELPREAERLVVVVDSVNRLAKGASSGSGGNQYFRALEKIARIAAASSKLSGGRIGWLLVSETNRKGGAVGMDVEFAAQCILYMRRRANPELVKFELLSRETEGGPLGIYRRDPQKCRFIPSESYSDAPAEDKRHQVRGLFGDDDE